MRAQGTIVGEGVSLAQPSQGLSLAQHSQSSCSSSRNPLAALSFPEHTSLRSSGRPSWSVYQSPEKETDAPWDPDAAGALLLSKSSFHRRQSEKKPSEENQDVPMSPKPHWFQTSSLTLAAEADLDVMKSPPVASVVTQPAWTIYQSPVAPPETDLLWAASPEPVAEQDLGLLSVLEEVDVLLPKKTFQRRESGLKALQALHESLLMSPKQAPEPAQEEPTSPSPAPGLDWFCSGSLQRPSKADLDVMASPAQSSRTTEAPVSPMDTSRAGMSDSPMSPRDTEYSCTINLFFIYIYIYIYIYFFFMQVKNLTMFTCAKYRIIWTNKHTVYIYIYIYIYISQHYKF